MKTENNNNLFKNHTVVSLILFIIFLILGAALYVFKLALKVDNQSASIEALATATIHNITAIAKERGERVATEEIKDSNIQAAMVYSDEKYKLYAFYNNINAIDLNFDGIPDVVLKSHINGVDYYNPNEISDRDIYSFYIDRVIEAPITREYWNTIAKEIPGKKINEFERDFVISDFGIPSCNGGETIRLVTTNKNETILAVIKMESISELGNFANFELYKLKITGGVVGSDYIFSHIKTVKSDYASCDLDKFANEDIIKIIDNLNL